MSRLWSQEKLASMSEEGLRERSLALEAEMRDIRALRLQIAGELERRQPQEQVVTPDTLVVDVEVQGQKRRWFR